MKVPFLNLAILKATSLKHLQDVLAMKRRDLTDAENRLDQEIMGRRMRDAEIARLREALWFAQAGGYAKADGGNLALAEEKVLAYEESRRWARNERLDLAATATLARLTDNEVHALSMAGTVEFRGLKWKVSTLTRGRPGPADDFYEPPLQIEMHAFADPTETVPDFKRHGA